MSGSHYAPEPPSHGLSLADVWPPINAHAYAAALDQQLQRLRADFDALLDALLAASGQGAAFGPTLTALLAKEIAPALPAPEPSSTPRPSAAMAELRERYGAAFDAAVPDPNAAYSAPDERTQYDLTSPAEREAELALRVDNLIDALAYEARARQALEAQVQALAASHATLTDVVQVLRLHAGL